MEMSRAPPTTLGLDVKQANNKTKYKHPEKKEKKIISRPTPSRDPWFCCSKSVAFFSLKSKSVLLAVLLGEDKSGTPACDELGESPGVWRLFCKRHKMTHAYPLASPSPLFVALAER